MQQDKVPMIVMVSKDIRDTLEALAIFNNESFDDTINHYLHKGLQHCPETVAAARQLGKMSKRMCENPLQL